MADSGTLAAGPGRPSWATRLRHFDPTILVWLLLAAVLVFLVVNPLLRLVLTSFAEKDTGVFTLANYAAAYGRPRYVQALWNSVLLGAAVSVLCLVLAVPLAWGVAHRHAGQGAGAAAGAGHLHYAALSGAIGWILLAGPNAGWINRIWRGLTGAEDPLFDIYSFPGLTLIIALYSFPYLFIFVSAALDLVSSEMEDAASILGAGKSHTTFRITLPLVLPAILGGLIITFLEAIALFGSPALIALPARFNVVTTQLWQFFSHPARVEVAAAFAMPLLLVTIALFWVQQRIIRRRGFVALTGKGGERRPMQLGRWRWLLFAYALLVLTLAVILPYLILGQAAFAKAWGAASASTT